MRRHRFIASVAAAVLAGAAGVASPAHAISGGEPVPPGEFPWMVRVLPVQCGGTLISPDLVLTAKHCVDDIPADGFTVVSSVVDLQDPAATMTPSVAAYAPPGWWGDHDWGLIKLAEPLELPTLPLATEPRELQTVTAAGWGASQWDTPQQRYLHKVELPFLPDDECPRTKPDHAGPYLCTRSVNQRSHCKGDSGGPGLHRLPDGSWEQIGIISFGSDCDWEAGEEPTPVYADVAYFAADIQRAAQDLLNIPAPPSSPSSRD